MNMENEIKQLLKSTDREDIKLGIILAIKELGIEWCKREFVSPHNQIHIGYSMNPHLLPPIAIKLKGDKEAIYAYAFIEYTNDITLDDQFDMEDYYEYTDYTD
jgi:hypothetical protein